MRIFVELHRASENQGESGKSLEKWSHGKHVLNANINVLNVLNVLKATHLTMYMIFLLL